MNNAFSLINWQLFNRIRFVRKFVCYSLGEKQRWVHSFTLSLSLSYTWSHLPTIVHTHTYVHARTRTHAHARTHTHACKTACKRNRTQPNNGIRVINWGLNDHCLFHGSRHKEVTLSNRENLIMNRKIAGKKWTIDAKKVGLCEGSRGPFPPPFTSVPLLHFDAIRKNRTLRSATIQCRLVIVRDCISQSVETLHP